MARSLGKPKVSIIIPTYNEDDYVEDCLDSLVDGFVAKNGEVIVADGRSTDQTRELVGKYIKNHPSVSISLLDNPKKHQAHGLNLGIKRSLGRFVVRADAHAVFPKNYVQRCVELLEKTGADNVGGVMRAKGAGGFQNLAALAMSHPIGVGDAKFHLGRESGYVDTVYLGTFRKDLFKKLGFFDPYQNQDAEFNLRILDSGGKIFLDNSIKVDYFPRNSLGGLISQYFNYGRGRCRTTLKHRRFTSFRQLAPILLVLGLFDSFFLSALGSSLFLLVPISYAAAMLLFSFLSLEKSSHRLIQSLSLALIFMSMHISWGVGFWAYLLGISR
jgi:glycosyltransferase involved in cell wall biosynthesis